MNHYSAEVKVLIGKRSKPSQRGDGWKYVVYMLVYIYISERWMEVCGIYVGIYIYIYIWVVDGGMWYICWYIYISGRWMEVCGIYVGIYIYISGRWMEVCGIYVGIYICAVCS